MSENQTPQVIEGQVVARTEPDPRDLLPEEERLELQKYEETVLVQDPRRTLAPVTAQKFFALFLQGYAPREIQELNPTFPLGIIIHARVKYHWDEERDRHVKDLMGRVREKVMLTQLESAHYLTDVIAATHKLNGTKIKKFLQTGDPAELGGIHIETLTSYSKTLEMLSKLTGQDRDNRKGMQSPAVNVFLPPAASGGAALPPGSSEAATRSDKLISPADAAQVVRALLEIQKVRDKK